MECVLSEVWRLKTKPGGATRPLREQLIGSMLDESYICTGWDHEAGRFGLAPYLEAVSEYYSPNAARNLRRFISELSVGDLVWIVDLQGLYHLAQVIEDWEYLNRIEIFGRYAVNKRRCHWLKKGLKSPDVAAGVRHGLMQGQTFCRIHDKSAKKFSLRMAGIENNDEPIDFLPLIDHEALEDLVGMYLQHTLKGCILPSSAKRSNGAYEFEIRSWDGTIKAVAQVKSGASVISDNLNRVHGRRYLFAMSGEYPVDLQGARIISAEKLRHFALENRTILPQTITIWLN